MRVGAVACRAALNKTGIPGYRYCLNPYVGCAHGCRYCYAAFMCRFAARGEAWGEFVDVKRNLVDALRGQLGSRRPPTGKVIVGTVTDAYQPVEARTCLTRSCLELLADYPALEVEILTKSNLVVRDLSLLARLRGSVGFTITVRDDRVARILEPGAAPPSARLAAIRKLREAGVDVWVFIAPLLPGLGDRARALRALLADLRRAGVYEVHVDPLNPYPAVVRRLRAAYATHFPEAVPHLERYLSQPRSWTLAWKRAAEGLFREFGYTLGSSA
ncbi:MAG: spore photoproduct lyase family protein [Bacillota bacterium]